MKVFGDNQYLYPNTLWSGDCVPGCDCQNMDIDGNFIYYIQYMHEIIEQ